MKTHKDIDFEYLVESIAQKRYIAKSNTLRYDQLKDIAEDEVAYFMENENDTLRNMRNRISFRYRHNITYILERQDNIWNNWRTNEFFITNYESDLKWGKRINKLFR